MSGRRGTVATALAAARAPGEPIAWRDGRAIEVAEFLADAVAVAEHLPDRGQVVNVCADRYRFAVGFAASLLRGQVSLMPPHRTAEFLGRLARAYPGTYCLADEPTAGPLETVSFPALGARSAVATPPPIPLAQTASIMFTSGSTGEPTPHAKTWGGLARGAIAEAAALGLDALPGAALVGTVPAQHMYGLESTVLLALCARAALVAARPFYPADVRSALEAVPAPRVLVTTPVHLRALEAADVDLPPLALIVCATAPLAGAAAARAEARYGAPLREIYGFTEAGMVASRRTTEGEAWTCLPGVALRRAGDEWWAADGHVPVPAPFADVIEVLADGRFLLRGRRQDMVNVAGKRASLAALNHQLLAVPGVRDGTYFVPSDGGGAVPRLGAFVVAPGIAREALLAALRERVEAAFLPRPLVFVESLPRNATGKLTHDALRGLVLAHDG